jgi:hypothetical protein
MSTSSGNIGLYIAAGFSRNLATLSTSGYTPNPYVPPPTGNQNQPILPSGYASGISLYMSSYYNSGPNTQNSANLYIKTDETANGSGSMYLYINGPRAPYDVASTQTPLFVSTIDTGSSPDTILGLKLWLDGYDSGTMTFSSSNVVSGWNDKSTYNNDFTVQSYSSPTYDTTTRTVNFTNAQTLAHHDYYMNLYDEYTVVIAAKNMGTGLLLAGVSTDESSFYASAPISALGINEITKIELESYVLSQKFYHRVGGFTIGSTQPIPNSGGIFTVARSPNLVKFYYNNRLISSGVVTDPLSKLNFGSINGYLDGIGLDNIAINEIIIYNRVINSGEMYNLNGYLNTKWNYYNPKFESTTLMVMCEEVSKVSGALYLYIDRPEYGYMPLMVYNRLVDSNLNLYTRCATHSVSGISMFSSGKDIPNSGLSLFTYGNNPIYTGINGLYS